MFHSTWTRPTTPAVRCGSPTSPASPASPARSRATGRWACTISTRLVPELFDPTAASEVDAATPELLVYGPGPTAGLRLVALEVPGHQGQLGRAALRPATLFDQPFNVTLAGNRYGLPDFYSLHADLGSEPDQRVRPVQPAGAAARRVQPDKHTNAGPIAGPASSCLVDPGQPGSARRDGPLAMARGRLRPPTVATRSRSRLAGPRRKSFCADVPRRGAGRLRSSIARSRSRRSSDLRR